MFSFTEIDHGVASLNSSLHSKSDMVRSAIDHALKPLQHLARIQESASASYRVVKATNGKGTIAYFQAA